MSGELIALVLAGGSGTRFWPWSRRQTPKQLLRLAGTTTLLRQTVERLRPLVAPEDVWVSTTLDLEGAVARELSELPPSRVLAEPESRNTAPAIAWALGRLPAAARERPVAVLPADHHVADAEAFRAALDTAAAAARSERRVVTLGVRPSRPETGYGYLELDAGSPAQAGVLPVRRFLEKPDAATAQRLFAGGRHLWNAGIFVFLPQVLEAELARWQPEISAAALRASAGGLGPDEERALYARLPAVSIDQGVMEHLDDALTVPLDCGWNDLGSWQALADTIEPDTCGNHSRGEVVAIDARDNVLVSAEGTVAVLGVEGLVVVHTGDAVLVMPRERSQEVRRIVSALEAQARLDRL